jgi:hypothetical protein
MKIILKIIKFTFFTLLQVAVLAYFLISVFIASVFISSVWTRYFPYKLKATEIRSPTGPQKAWKGEWVCLDGPCDRIIFYNGKKTSELEFLKGDWDWLDTMVFTSDGKYLAVLITGSELLVYNGKTGEEIKGRFSLADCHTCYPPTPQWRFVGISGDTIELQSYTPKVWYYTHYCKPAIPGTSNKRRLLLPNLTDVR